VTEAWVGSFTDPEGGKKAAKKLYDGGAYVIFHAAGLTGNGVFEEAMARAKKRDTRWVIGVDVDQYASGVWELGKSVTLTSFVKRTDAAANFLARTSDIQKELWGGVFVLGVNEGGVGLPRDNPNLTADMAKAIAEFEKKIYDGLIVVKDKL
jgi:basic membrane protein A